MDKKKLLIQQLDKKMIAFAGLKKVSIPTTGWIKAVRTAIGMSLIQLGKKLSITKQSAQNIEKREREGTISLKALRETAEALDMEFVYGFVPKDGALEKMIDRKARELATQIVLRTSNSMKLEDQENTPARIKQAIEEKTIAFKNELPKILWD